MCTPGERSPRWGGGDNPTVSDDNFTIEVVDVTSNSISIHVTPTDTAAEWFAYPVASSSANYYDGAQNYIDGNIGWNSSYWYTKNDSNASSFTGEKTVKLSCDPETSYEVAVWKGTNQIRNSDVLSITVETK